MTAPARCCTNRKAAFRRSIFNFDCPKLAHNRPPLYYTNGRLSLHCRHWAFRRPTLFCTQRGVGFLCRPTLFCTKRLTFKLPLKPGFQPQNANSRNKIKKQNRSGCGPSATHSKKVGRRERTVPMRIREEIQEMLYAKINIGV